MGFLTSQWPAFYADIFEGGEYIYIYYGEEEELVIYGYFFFLLREAKVYKEAKFSLSLCDFYRYTWTY